MEQLRLAVIAGDGIGPEVTLEARRAMRAALEGVELVETEYELGARSTAVLIAK